jgi:hypothetical protein
MKSQIKILIAAGLVSEMLVPSFRILANETVVPNEAVPPPSAEQEAPADSNANSFFLVGRQSCYGQNNRHTGNAATLKASDWIYQVFEFELTDGSQYLYRIKRPGNALYAPRGPAHTCTYVPSIHATLYPATGTFAGTCPNTTQGKNHCNAFLNWPVGQNRQFKCVGAAHPGTAGLGELHSCLKMTGGGISCSHASATAASPGHENIRPVRQFFLRRTHLGGWGNRVNPSQLSMNHIEPLPNLTLAVEQRLNGGSSWAAVPGAEIGVNDLNDFSVKVSLGSAAPLKRVIDFSGVARVSQQIAGANPSNCGFSGCTGSLTYRQGKIVERQRSIVSNISVAARDGICGGFHSPLMVFFPGEKAPQFSGTSKFKMGTEGASYTWPEKGNQGWFIARDLHGDRSVRDESQLFGNNDLASDGFAALAEFDENKDRVIDQQDAVFAQLIFWNDVNSDSKSQKREVKSAAELGIESISVDAMTNTQLKFEDRAIAKGASTFRFKKNKKGELLEGKVYDIWFAEIK